MFTNHLKIFDAKCQVLIYLNEEYFLQQNDGWQQMSKFLSFFCLFVDVFFTPSDDFARGISVFQEGNHSSCEWELREEINEAFLRRFFFIKWTTQKSVCLQRFKMNEGRNANPDIDGMENDT